eukprot:356516-Chlamydomonas_euryale.AAC.5
MRRPSSDATACQERKCGRVGSHRASFQQGRGWRHRASCQQGRGWRHGASFQQGRGWKRGGAFSMKGEGGGRGEGQRNNLQ